MTQPKATCDYLLTFPKDDEGEEVKYRFMLTLGKRGTEKINGEEIKVRLQKALGSLDGIDGIGQGGLYTVEVVIARTFDADEVIAELEKRLKADVFGTIMVPKLVQP